MINFSACRAESAPTGLTGRIHTIRLPNRGVSRQVETFDICLASSDDQIKSASELVNRMYSWRGYGADHQLPSALNCATFTASVRGQVFGTLTLTVDSDNGLAADQTFAPEVQRFRGFPGVKLCELTKFAVDTSASSRPLLAALFHIVFIYGSRKFGCSDLLIEVNPRHRRFYEVMLGFKSVGDVRTNRKVDAPAHLLWLPVADVRRHIDRFTNDQSYSARTLYSSFFSEQEERGIYARLAMEAAQSSELVSGTLQPAHVGPVARALAA